MKYLNYRHVNTYSVFFLCIMILKQIDILSWCVNACLVTELTFDFIGLELCTGVIECPSISGDIRFELYWFNCNKYVLLEVCHNVFVQKGFTFKNVDGWYAWRPNDLVEYVDSSVSFIILDKFSVWFAVDCISLWSMLVFFSTKDFLGPDRMDTWIILGVCSYIEQRWT